MLRYVFKPTLAEGKNSIISRTMGSKLCKMIYKAELHYAGTSKQGGCLNLPCANKNMHIAEPQSCDADRHILESTVEWSVSGVSQGVTGKKRKTSDEGLPKFRWFGGKVR